MNPDKIRDKIQTSFTVKQIGNVIDIKPLDGGLESRNFILTTDIGKFVLKSFKNTSIDEIEFELSILEHLNKHLNSFPIPVTKAISIDGTSCVIYSFLSGRGLIATDVEPSTLVKIASLQAEMHKEFLGFIPNGKRERFSINDLSFLDVFASPNQKYTNDLLDRGKKWLQKNKEINSRLPLPKSIIHEDLEMENIFIDETGNIKFIDFGEAFYAEVISDIATVIKELIINNKGLAFDLVEKYIIAYNLVNPIIDKIQLKILYPLLVRRTLFMLSYFLYRQSRDKSTQFNNKIKVEINTLELLLSPNDLNKKIINISL